MNSRSVASTSDSSCFTPYALYAYRRNTRDLLSKAYVATEVNGGAHYATANHDEGVSGIF
ncbi:hypothetical protein BVC80_1367g53 [Macleaya cordata]|uniref:Uncharacterized protein n=1 Tax=Macleaya cordata TaxID=56857 RepID=A0A200QVJ6_MACCD|nr:hypothetical protein BVC80_1367g53 [Macleaya cordata]